MKTICVLIGSTLLVGGSLFAAESHPFDVHDLVSMERISDPRVSPAGNRVVFVRRSTDLEANKGRTDLWLVGTDGQALSQLTSHEAGDGNPRWSADGEQVFFLSSRTGSSQVWSIAVDGGEAWQVTDLPLDVSGLVVSPDGEHLAISMEVFPDCETLACTKERLEERQEDKTSGQVFDGLFIRHWDTWKDGRRSHVFVIAIEGEKETVEPIDVTRGLVADVPSKPFGGPEEITFTADGKGIVFAARDAGESEPWSTNFDLYHVPVDGSSVPRNLTEANRAWDTQPVFSPDGKRLAYLAMARPGFESDRFRVVVLDWPAGEPRVLTEGWDRSPSSLVFSKDGGTIYTTAADVGEVGLFAIDVGSGASRKITGGGHVRSPSVAGERIVFGLDTLLGPVELFSVRPDGAERRQLTAINKERLSRARRGEFEQFSFKGWNEETVWGYAIRPADFEPDNKYPLAFLIHGGPQGSFDNDFHYRWNPQAYAGAGYGVVTIDFHGSVGYGQEFTDSITGDWGGKPLEDLQKGLVAAIERYPWIDGDRVCALGASYGGFMVNWIAGNWPERFRCLVNHDGTFDNRMMYYATEELWFPEWEHGGTYWDNPAGHEEHNPATHVDKWKTPMLVVHGAHDYRIPETQGIATFTALQRRSIPSRFLYFPDENHWVLKPANSIQWHEEVLGWLDRWLKDE